MSEWRFITVAGWLWEDGESLSLLSLPGRRPVCSPGGFSAGRLTVWQRHSARQHADSPGLTLYISPSVTTDHEVQIVSPPVCLHHGQRYVAIVICNLKYFLVFYCSHSQHLQSTTDSSREFDSQTSKSANCDVWTKLIFLSKHLSDLVTAPRHCGPQYCTL